MVLYDANRKTFENPNDPDLILPGQVLEIPSLQGEIRAGTYDPAKPYGGLPQEMICRYRELRAGAAERRPVL
ncbi:MAG: hypothetical protein M0C28_48750 [Candidatus Moduliflexus flocculans]|nr:hypothetical protein [Candidatus Moduliflexus flocculans]